MSNLLGRENITWVDIDKKALVHNIRQFRYLVGDRVLLAPCVKANAYGHGMEETGKILLKSGADWLSVNSLFEARKLRASGVHAPVYIMGYVLQSELSEAISLDCRMVVYNKESVLEIAKAAKKMHKKARVHMKIETGNNRQGVAFNEVADFAKFIKEHSQIELEGIATHFSNIEDTQDPKYAKYQLKKFRAATANLASARISVKLMHCANSAAIILFPETHFTMVRPGIAVYGMWPSENVKQAAEKKKTPFTLFPALSWHTRIAQIKEVPKGGLIGYGCTHKTKRKTRLAILPVGYYDGYVRGFSNASFVLIHGARAPVLGRVCMNITMVDVTEIPEARLEDPVTLLGQDGEDEISADMLAQFSGTINYEVTTRIREGIPRFYS